MGCMELVVRNSKLVKTEVKSHSAFMESFDSSSNFQFLFYPGHLEIRSYTNNAQSTDLKLQYM